jgi:hypothetical protein
LSVGLLGTSNASQQTSEKPPVSSISTNLDFMLELELSLSGTFALADWVGERPFRICSFEGETFLAADPGIEPFWPLLA